MKSNSPSTDRVTLLKLFYGVLIVFGVGAVAIMMQDSERQLATDAFMLTTKHLKENATAECPVAIRQVLKSEARYCGLHDQRRLYERDLAMETPRWRRIQYRRLHLSPGSGHRKAGD